MSANRTSREGATDGAPRAALIVAHGSPSDPASQEAALAALAQRIGARLPGWQVRGATLAAPGALDAAVHDLAPGARVFPFFMSDGWFVSTELPRRLRAAGACGHRVLAPLGQEPAMPALCLRASLDAAAAHGLDAAETALLLAGHGSPGDPRPRQAVERTASVMRERGGFRAVVTGYVDEAPRLAEAARLAGPALCLPFFASRAGHVETDLPEALAEAAFPGPLLEPVGLHAAIPEIVAAALDRATDTDARTSAATWG